MRKGLFFMFIIGFVFSLFSWPGDVDTGSTQYIDTGAAGLGYGYVTKIRKDVFESKVLKDLNNKVSEKEFPVESFSMGEGDYALNIDGMSIKVSITYFRLEPVANSWNIFLGLKINDVLNAGFSGGLIDLIIEQDSSLNEIIVNKELTEYLKVRLQSLGSMNIKGGIEISSQWGENRMNGASLSSLEVSGWEFTNNSVVKANGLSEYMAQRYNELIFSRIGIQLADNIINSFVEDAEFMSIFSSVRSSCFPVYDKFCSVQDLISNDCIDSNCYEDKEEKCVLNENSECLGLINNCIPLNEECTGAFVKNSLKIISSGINVEDAEKSSVYLTGYDSYSYYGKSPYSFKVVGSDGKVLREKTRHCPENGCNFLKIADSYPSWSLDDKITPMEDDTLIKIYYSKDAIGTIFEKQVEESIAEMIKEKDASGESMALIGSPVFSIKSKLINDPETGLQINKNVASVKISIEGTEGDGWSESDYSFDAHLFFLPKIIEKSGKKKLLFEYLGAETSDVDADFPPWLILVDVLFLGIFSPADLVSYGISEIVIAPVLNLLVMNYAEDSVNENLEDTESVENGDIENSFRKTLDPVFGEDTDYEFNAYFESSIDGEYINRGFVIEAKLKSSYSESFSKRAYLTTVNKDSDGDGIYDVKDNCPSVYNPYQTDDDGDGIGNRCDGGPRNEIIWIPLEKDAEGMKPPLYYPFHDTDGDGVANASDNCPAVPNPFIEADGKMEIISGKCFGDSVEELYGISSCLNPLEGGAINNILVNKFLYVEDGGCFGDLIPYWQPDSDLDGLGDKCDKKDGVGVLGMDVSELIEEYDVPDIFLGYSSLDMSTEMRSVDDPARQKKRSGVITFKPVITNRYVDVSVEMNTASGTFPFHNYTNEKLSQRYCWVDKVRMDSWGDYGFCTTTEGGGKRSIPQNRKFISIYGYSHGSDLKPTGETFKESWQEPVWEDSGNSGYKKCKDNCGFTWDWRKNLENDHPLLYLDYVRPVDNKNEIGNSNSFITYAFSSGVKSDNDDFSYIIEENDLNVINPLHFKNLRIYARSKRDSFGGKNISYYRGYEVDHVDPFQFGWMDMDLMREIYGINPWWWMVGPEEPIENNFLDIYRYSDGGLSLIEKGLDSISDTGILESVSTGTDNTVGVYSLNSNSGTKVMMTSRNAGSAWSVGAVVEMPNYSGFITGVKEVVPGQLFVMTDRNSVYAVNVGSFSGSYDTPLFQVCSGTAEGVDISQLPFDGRNVEITVLDGRILLFNKNAPTTELYELNIENKTLTHLEYDNAPVGRAHVNIDVAGSELYVAGGAESEGTQLYPLDDVYRFTFENGWEIISEHTGINLMGAVTAVDGNKIKVYSKPLGKADNITLAVIDRDTLNMEITTEKLNGVPFSSEKYCVYDDNDEVFPGLEKRHVCRVIDDYEYKGYTFFDYKLTVAGYEDYLFAGGLTGIRTFEIKENGKLEKKQFKTLGMINNIAVQDGILYATRGDKVFIFEIKENGELEKISSIKTNGCRNIRVSGKYLFTGEEERVNIYDISIPSSPVKVNNIKTSYNVKDLELTGGRLYIYQEKGWWFWKDYEITEYDVIDINNIVKEGSFEMECNDSEMMYDESHVYLGCKNGQYRIDKSETGLNPEQVEGKKNYFRDTYVRKGIIYTVHSGKIFLSR